MALHDFVTPTDGRRTSDITKSRLTLRDVALLVIGAAGMWGTQIATQGRMQAAIDKLDTKFDGYVLKQNDTNGFMQQQIDELRRQTSSNNISARDNEKALAELKGILLGAGIKGVTK